MAIGRDWPPRRVLLGFDGSDGAKDAVELCRALAPAGAYVAAVDVLPYPGAPSAMFRLLSGAELEAPEDYFAPAVSGLPGRKVDTLTYLGDSPARIFESYAAEAAIDLIVVGSPHHGAIGRVLSGSVVQALLHGSPVPVATAPHGYAGRAPEKPGTIAVAYDGGAESRAALAHGQALARAAGARLEVLTVARPTDPVGGAIAYTFDLPEDVDDIQRQALGEVDPGIDLRRRVLDGETAAALVDACRDDVDLLVVGSRGYGTVERVLLGSTSTELIRTAECPVLVVPRPAGV
ncbi:MAG: universal stress protein [Solirubrobacterales bacterium]